MYRAFILTRRTPQGRGGRGEESILRAPGASAPSALHPAAGLTQPHSAMDARIALGTCRGGGEEELSAGGTRELDREGRLSVPVI